MNYLGYSFIALVGWGLWGFGAKLVVEHMPALTAAFYSSVLGALLLGVVVAVTGQFVWNRAAVGALGIGLVSTVAVVGFYLALARGPASVVIPLTGLYFVIPAVLGVLVLHEPVRLTKTLGVLCAIAATILLAL